MTRFVGEAKDVRQGRVRRFPTGKEMKKEMEVFKRTGRHPALEGNNADSLPALPERDMNRRHVFLDIRQGTDDLGRLVIEVFEDKAPLAARHLLNRCREGTTDALKGVIVHRLLPDSAIFLGTSNGYRGAGVQVRHYDYLHHNHAGVVSLSGDASEVVITVTKAIYLDSSYQVVGRAHKGLDILNKLNEAAVDPDDLPLQPVLVTACGLCDSEGIHESLDESAKREALRKETPEQAAARLRAESKIVRDSVKAALQTGLAQKRKPEGEAQSKSSKKQPQSGMMSAVLGDLSDESSDEDS